MMKRLLVLILAAAMILSLAACGEAKDPDCGFEGFPTSLDDLCARMQKYLDESKGDGKYILFVENLPSAVENPEKTIWVQNQHGKNIAFRVRPMVPNQLCPIEKARLMAGQGADPDYLRDLAMAMIRACDVDIGTEDARALIERMVENFTSNSSDVIDETIGSYRIIFRIEDEIVEGVFLYDPFYLTITPIE